MFNIYRDRDRDRDRKRRRSRSRDKERKREKRDRDRDRKDRDRLEYIKTDEDGEMIRIKEEPVDGKFLFIYEKNSLLWK